EQFGQHATAANMQSKIALAEQNKQKNVADLMKQYNTLFHEAKYEQAEMAAVKAHDLYRDNPVPSAALDTAKTMKHPMNYTKFKDTTLEQVIYDLKNLTGLNIVATQTVLAEAGISLSQKVSKEVDNISLASALKVLLDEMNLTWVIEDEVLKITTYAHSKGKIEVKTYQVADLIVPVENYALPASASLSKVLDQRMQQGSGMPAT